jgi:hypothetical protein
MLWPILLTSVLLQLFGMVTPLFTQIILVLTEFVSGSTSVERRGNQEIA